MNNKTHVVNDSKDVDYFEGRGVVFVGYICIYSFRLETSCFDGKRSTDGRIKIDAFQRKLLCQLGLQMGRSNCKQVEKVNKNNVFVSMIQNQTL